MDSNERMRRLAFSEMEMMPAASDNGSQPYSRAAMYDEPTVTVRASEGK